MHNIVTVVMRQFSTDITGSMKWIENHHKDLEAKFTETYFQLPRWGGPVDRQVAQYVDGLANWVRASDQWGFESQRYFGRNGCDVQKTRWVTLLPQAQVFSGDIGPQLVDASAE